MSKKYILCVDDEKIVLNSLKTQLKDQLRQEYYIETAESGEEAMEILEELEVDEEVVILVVSDWLMPGMKGDEFLINVHKKYPGIKTIMLTGQADSEAIERAKREANLFECLEKPWKNDDLLGTINAALKK